MADARDDEGAGDAAPRDAAIDAAAIKEKSEPRIRNFVAVNRWSHDDHSMKEMDWFIRRHIKHINDPVTTVLVSIPSLVLTKITIRNMVQCRNIKIGTPRKEPPTLCSNVL